jgi:hydroxylaminobenzene mutase
MMGASDRKLMLHGMLLFLLGLVAGFLEKQFTNVRMGLSAHLEGVMNGTFLVALGAIWNHVRLPRPVKTTAFWTALCGTYGNWLVTMLAAIFGTAANTPIAAAGHRGQPWQESLVAAGFLSVAIAMVVSVLLVLWGLSDRVMQKSEGEEQRDRGPRGWPASAAASPVSNVTPPHDVRGDEDASHDPHFSR